MKMETRENSCDSLPYIDESPDADEDDAPPHQYNLKISENYRERNRNIEISNRFSRDGGAECFGPVGPGGEEGPGEGGGETREPVNGMKVVVRGWNPSISIQGLDNKSSITFKRRCGKSRRKGEETRGEEKEGKGGAEESKPKRGRWKTLTKSLMLARAGRFERRGLDERYPKYVLLKNEEEEEEQQTKETRESYPKMFVFNERKQKPAVFRPDFNLRKSFKNKTEPILPLEEILAKAEEGQHRRRGEGKQPKQALTDRARSEKRNVLIQKRVVVERQKSLKPEGEAVGPPPGFPLPPGFVCNEIQGIFEDTLKLLPQNADAQRHPETRNDLEHSSPSRHPQFCRFPCHDPYCCLGDRPPNYLPVYSPPRYLSRNPSAQERENVAGGEDLGDLSFGILSRFFPRVVIMKAINGDDVAGEDGREGNANADDGCQQPGASDPQPRTDVPVGLQIPRQDLSLKSKLVQRPPEPEDSTPSDVSLKESSETKTQESEATTEYLQYSEFPDPPENESADRRTPEQKTETPLPPAQTHQNGDEDLTLTKIGYKMYDSLTKLSLNRDRDTNAPEVRGCGCNGNEAKRKPPCDITFESSSSVVKVTVPENEFNFQFVNSQGAGIQIGVGARGGGRKSEEEKREEEGEEEKKLVRREELWHCDGGGKAVVLRNDGLRDGGFQKVKLSLGDNKDVILSIETNEGDKKEEKKTKGKQTKEMKVGTDDFHLAGGDFASSGGSHQNLSPRIGRLLKHLHEKLESDERDRKCLEEKIERKLLREGLHPGVFLVKHISPRNQVALKPEVPLLDKAKKLADARDRAGAAQVREYYCEECLATMRIFEDENPSVKSMVDKFETIIQLESY